MTHFEAAVMKDVCKRHIEQHGTIIISEYMDFRSSWINKDFTRTFEYITHTVLNKIEINILYAYYDKYYNDNGAISKIGEELLIEDNIVACELDCAIDKLADVYTFKQLYMGRAAFTQMIKDKQAEFDDIIYNRHDNEKIFLSMLDLNNRAVNILTRFFCKPATQITTDEVLNKINNLLNVRGCSYKTAMNIINAFNEFNIDCNKWIKAAKNINIIVDTDCTKQIWKEG